MKIFRVFSLVSILFSMTASAASYIVPVAGYTKNLLYGSSIRILDAGTEPATVSVIAIYPWVTERPCSGGTSFVLQPGEIRSVAAEERPFFNCIGVYALEIDSDRPIFVRAAIRRLLGAEQRIDVAERWIDSGMPAMIADVENDSSIGTRANLFVVNPNDYPLTVREHVERPEFGTTLEETFVVAPRSLGFHPLPDLKDTHPPTGVPQVLNMLHNIRLTADGRFQAGASSIAFTGDATWRPAVGLQTK